MIDLFIIVNSVPQNHNMWLTYHVICYDPYCKSYKNYTLFVFHNQNNLTREQYYEKASKQIEYYLRINYSDSVLKLLDCFWDSIPNKIIEIEKKTGIYSKIIPEFTFYMLFEFSPIVLYFLFSH